MVLLASTARRSLAARPTSTLPLGWKETTEGISTCFASSSSAEACPSRTTETTVFVVPRSIPITVDMASAGPRRGGQIRQGAVVPGLHRALERPHPAVIRAREARHDVRAQMARLCGFQSQKLGRSAQCLFVRLPFDARAAV